MKNETKEKIVLIGLGMCLIVVVPIMALFMNGDIKEGKKDEI